MAIHGTSWPARPEAVGCHDTVGSPRSDEAPRIHLDDRVRWHHGDVDLASASVTEQLAAFEQMVTSNPVVAGIVERLPLLRTPNTYLAAGALFQTVWNRLSERAPDAGINDYDINYFDDSDLSREGEDAVRLRALDIFADLDCHIDVVNEARVHLWYASEFGVARAPYERTEAAIDSHPSISCCFGIQPTGGGIATYAPHGFSDLFGLRTRPNLGRAPREAYDAKTNRWRREWPRLSIIPWPAEESGSSI